MDAELPSVPISALQHFLYCPRQCALIHLEQIWTESAHTAQGRLLHERVDVPRAKARRGVRTVTAMPLNFPAVGLHGVADVVEIESTVNGDRVVPVEFKRGRPKLHRADEVQLCAQALCLEHMLGRPVVEGALFYGATRRRQVVSFDEELRKLTVSVTESVRAMFLSMQTPTAAYDAKRCDRCSLLADCRPQMLAQRHRVVDWMTRQVKG